MNRSDRVTREARVPSIGCERAALAACALLFAPAALLAQGQRLSAPMPPGSDVDSFLVSADGAHAVYRADQEVDGVFELYSVALDLGTPPVKLNAPLPPGGDVQSYAVGAAGRVVYLADQLVDERVELFSVPVDGSGPVLRLNSTLVALGSVRFFTLGPDGTTVVYGADQEVYGKVQLYAVPVDASQPPLGFLPWYPQASGPRGLSTGLRGRWSVDDAWISPDGSRVVFTASRTDPNGQHLFSAPIDASRPPIHLARVLPFDPNHGVTRVDFSPDGRWVTFVVAWVIDGEGGFSDLHLVPADGSQAATKLDDVPTPTSTLAGRHEFTPGGERVLFSVSHYYCGCDGPDLYSATLDGLATELEPQVQNVHSFQLGPDEATVFYSSEVGLHAVPVDGSAPPSLLVPGDTGALSIAPDGSRLVYLAGELFGLPLAGGTPVVLVSAPSGRRILSFEISPDSRHVLYRTARSLYGDEIELLAAPIDGSSSKRLGRALPVGSSNPPFADHVLAGGGRVVYRSEQESAGVFELFLSFVERPQRPAPPPR